MSTTRRSHRKSRTGCYTCKKRHVKCDERGPPCDQCRRRDIECKSLEPTQARSAWQSNSTSTTTTGQATQAVGETRSIPNDGLMDLELMHQWSIQTFKSFCGAQTEDFHLWQVLVPREALKHRFLLYSMLATSSLEIGMSSEHQRPSRYISTALEYQDLALNNFRAEMVKVTESNHQAAFAFSLFTMILSIAMPQYDGSSMVEGMVLHFELMRGIGSIYTSSSDWLQGGPFTANVRPFDELPIAPLEASIEVALERLGTLNDERNDPARQGSRAARLQAISHQAVCRKAIFHLEECFARCMEPLHRGHSLAWLSMAGPEYVEAIKKSEPVALFILMHWGVLAEMISEGVWWAKDAGKNLVDQLSSTIHVGDDPVLQAGISWARAKVGLS